MQIYHQRVYSIYLPLLIHQSNHQIQKQVNDKDQNCLRFYKNVRQFIYAKKIEYQIIIQQMDIALNPLKRIVKLTLNRDPLEEIFWGSPTADTYLKVLNNYRSLPPENRQQTIARCLKKLYKPKEAELTIANLALLQKLMKIDYICLPMKEPQVLESSKKKEISMAEKNLVKFYFQFLKMEEEQISNKMVSMEEKISFCELGMRKCLSIINSQIILDYCISHSPNQVTLRIALKDIFQACRKDLELTNTFINTHAKMIYEQSTEVSFAINEIYETLIFVSRNIGKIGVLVKKAGLSMNLLVYQMDREMNMRIEMEMNARKEQKVKFRTEKCIKSRKCIKEEQVAGGEMGMKGDERKGKKGKVQRGFVSLSEIDQDDILIQSEGLL